MDFCISYDYSNSLRQAYRMDYPTLEVFVAGGSALHSVKNISVTGIAFHGIYEDLEFGDTLTISIILAGRILFSELKAEILYIDKEEKLTACAFKDLNRPQMNKMDVLILRLQKAEIKRQQKIDTSEEPRQ